MEEMCPEGEIECACLKLMQGIIAKLLPDIEMMKREMLGRDCHGNDELTC